MTSEERMRVYAQVIEPVNEWLVPLRMGFQEYIVTESVVFLLIGALGSWLVSRHFYKKSSVEVPEWFKPVFKQLPDQQPILEEFLDLIRNTIPRKEAGSNSFGSYFREDNGRLTCEDKFSVKHYQAGEKILISFPAAFINPPAVVLSGQISRITSKTATESFLVLEVTPMEIDEELLMGYQAIGYWKRPTSSPY